MAYRLICAFLFVLFAVHSAPAQPRPLTDQEAARDLERQWKDWEKAVRKARKENAKDVRRALKPGSKDLPEGTSRNPAEFPVRKLKMADLGIHLANEGPGVVIEQIDPQGHLAKVGFRERDRILYVDEFQIREERDFIKYLLADQVRSGKVGIVALRDDGTYEEIFVAPSEVLEGTSGNVKEDPLARLGVEVGDKAGNDLRVADVLPQTPADTAGVRRGDVILAFGNKKVKSLEHLGRLIANAEPGVYELTVKRDQSEPTLDVNLK